MREPQLSLLSPAGDDHREETSARPRDEIRIVTWNVQHANSARTHRQVLWLAKQSAADVLVLTEVSAGATGELLADLLEEFGYQTVLPAVTGAADRYRVLLAWRGMSGTVLDVELPVLPHRCAAVRLTVGQTECCLVGLYVPSRGPKAQRNVAKRAFQDAVAQALPGLADRFGPAATVVVAGDLNVVEVGHEPHYPVFGEWEYEFYRSFGKCGLSDAFRLYHTSGMDYSWFGRAVRNGQRNGYRFDHIFLRSEHAYRLRSCDYVHSVREQGLSDHSAMQLTMMI